MTQISVLGPVAVHDDAVAVRVPGGRSAELLVRLALDAGTVVRTDTLLDDLWADEAGSTRRNTLHSKVARLRRALGPAPAIESTADGYRLVVAGAQVDALAVVGEADEARRLLDDGDPRRAGAVAATALDRFDGEILPSAGTGDWVIPHRVRLEEARLTLLVTRAAARLALDDAAAAIGDLEDTVAAHPFHEPSWELLVTALARSGRQADALAAYQRARTLLADELGLEPGPGLRAIEARVLGQDEAVAPTGRTPARGNLPALPVALVGRDAQLAALAVQVAEHRLIEVVGPGGVGKTALAVAVARQQATADTWPGGVWLVRLEEATTAEAVTDALVAALDVTGGDAALDERLRGPAMLVVLDNCEHVIDEAAALALRMIDTGPGLCVLATTQVPLDIDGAHRIELAPLAPPDAVALFERRALAQRAGRPRPQADGAVRDLCRALDGLPLAIELAAARTRTLSVEEITRRLDDRFTVLNDPASRRPERRRALRATIRWSYDLLFPDDQRALWALAPFTGGAALDAVESVLAALDVPPAAALDAVDRLAARSLVIVDEDDPGTVRYRLLDSIRAFALDVVADAGADEQIGAAHAAWFAAAADRSTAGVRSADQARHLAFVGTERANIDAALGWAAAHDPVLAVRIAEGFGWAWIVLGDDRGAPRLLTALAAAGTAAPADRRARALLLAAWIEASTGALDTARVHVAEAEALAGDDIDLRARCAYHLAYVVSHEGDWDEGLRLTDVARATYEGLDRPWDRIANALFATRAAISAGDEARSEAGRDEVLHLLGHVDDPWMQVRADAMLGELARLQHRFTEAVDHIGRAADASLRLGFRQTEAYQRASLGRARWQAGDHEAGAADLALAVDHALAVGDLRMAALARVHLGRALRALGRLPEARAALDAAARWHRRAGGGEQAALGECLLAALDARDGDPTAPARLQSLLADAEAAGDRPHVAVFALDALARHAREAGDADRATALADRADAHMPASAHFISSVDRTDDVRWVRPA